jgi:putative PIN family toxin of toxin-antitoxin system
MRKEHKKPRVTIDTNLVISGTISPQSIPSQLLTAFTQGEFYWVLTEDTFTEIHEVLTRDSIIKKYHIDEDYALAFLENLTVAADFVKALPLNSLPVHSRDAKDDILLACAVTGHCNFLITGDEDLLVLNGRPELGRLKIIKAAEFLRRIK